MSSRVTRASNKTSHPGRLLDLVPIDGLDDEQPQKAKRKKKSTPRNETEPINLDAVAAVEDRAAQRKADRRKDTQQRAFKPTAKEPATLPNPTQKGRETNRSSPSGPVYASQTSSDAAQEYSQVAQGRSEVAQERGEFDAQRFPERPVTRAPAQDRQRQEYVVPRVGTRDVDEVGPSLREDEGGYAPAGLDPADGEDGENLFAGGYEGAEVEDVSEMGSRELVVDRATAPPSSGDEYFEDDYYAAGYIDNDGDDSSADPDYDANEEEEGHEEEDEEVDEEDEGAEEGDVIARAPKKGKVRTMAQNFYIRP
ncbi:hypothetical protein BD626DRAFT_252453 [Schizophyllum amplum]|uniref:Uncharacterized protein n=1 Tax=Schizophyllum amplum TaxID=97359 RepID=A0A550CI87_9AGAR|nr:hypothetical protein BD626DRAFT_252453 [Auriculariopsis ampla]